MNTRIIVFGFLFLFLSACASTTTLTAPPAPAIPTSTPSPEAIATATIATPTVEMPTNAATEQTATLELTTTLQTTSTSTSALQMTIISDEQPTAAPPSGSCQPPQNWVAYTVQVSDTLSSLAQRTGTSWQQIQAANCLTGTVIFAGQPLYLPFIPSPDPGNTPVISKTPVPPGPGNPQLTITPTAGYPGDIFTIVMDDFPRNNPIRLVIIHADAGTLILRATLTPDAEGDATYPYKSPKDAMPGTYTVRASSSAATPVTKDGEFKIHRPPTQYP